MTLTQQIITVAMVVLGTAVTRFLPFLIFPAGKPTPKYIKYLGRVLPPAVFGLLVIYCLKNVSVFTGSHGSGTDFDYTGDCPACVEEADASVHCRRYGVLYAACAACFLKQKNLTDMDECGIRPALRKKRRELSRIFFVRESVFSENKFILM